MISEGSCDTDDWSNDAENSALILLDHKTSVKSLGNICSNSQNTLYRSKL